jgi:hypothetical protein
MDEKRSQTPSLRRRIAFLLLCNTSGQFSWNHVHNRRRRHLSSSFHFLYKEKTISDESKQKASQSKVVVLSDKAWGLYTEKLLIKFTNQIIFHIIIIPLAILQRCSDDRLFLIITRKLGPSVHGEHCSCCCTVGCCGPCTDNGTLCKHSVGFTVLN